MRKIALEVCIDSVASAIAAEEGGAARVELCANLPDGGTTPSAGMIGEVRKNISIPLHVMIRPRAGDFCYSGEEFELMKKDILLAKQLGANGVVFGILQPDGSIDLQRTKMLTNLARPLSVTFHRAFDTADAADKTDSADVDDYADAVDSLEKLIDLGIDRLLTSGRAATAYEGRDCIRALREQSRGRIVVMPGSGIHEGNIAAIVKGCGVEEIHVRSAVTVNKRSRSSTGSSPDDSLGVVDRLKVKGLLHAGMVQLMR